MLGIGWSNGAIYLGIVALMVATVADWPRFRVWAVRSPVFWAVAVLSLYFVLRDQWSGPVPVPDSERADELKDLLDVAGIPALALAWWCAQYPRHVLPLIGVAALGLVLGLGFNLDWARLADYLALREKLRVHLGGNGPSVFGGALMVGVLVVGSWSLTKSTHDRRRSFLLAAGLVLLFLFGVWLLLAGKTRTAWVATAGTLVLLGVWMAWRFGWGATVDFLRRYGVAVAGGLAVGVLVVLAAWEPIVDRMTREGDVWRDIAALQFEDVEQSSIGLRITQWRIGFDAFLQHPWFGTGFGSAAEVMERSDIPIRLVFPHFHSLYLHVLVITGLVGFVLFAILVVACVREAIRGIEVDAYSNLMARFAAVSALYFGFVSLAVIRFDDPHGMAYMILVMAFAVAPGMRRSLVEKEKGPGGRAQG